MMIESVGYEFIVNLLSILNLFSLFARDIFDSYGYSAGTIRVWIYVQFAINFLFLFEMFVEFYIFGLIKAYSSSWRVRTETVS